MAKKQITVDAVKILEKEFKIDIKVKRIREVLIRYKIGMFFIRLAAFIMVANIDIDLEDEDE